MNSYSIPQVFVLRKLSPCPPSFSGACPLPPPCLTQPPCGTLCSSSSGLYPPPTTAEYPPLEQYFYSGSQTCSSSTTSTDPLTYYYLYLTPTTSDQFTFSMQAYSSTVNGVSVGTGTAVLSSNQLELSFQTVSSTPLQDSTSNQGHILFFRSNLERLGFAYFTGTDITMVLPGWYRLYPSTVCNYPARGYYF